MYWDSNDKRICLPQLETKETLVSSLSREDSLEEEMATLSCILSEKIPRTDEPSRLQSMGHKEPDTTEHVHTHTHTHTHNGLLV